MSRDRGETGPGHEAELSMRRSITTETCPIPRAKFDRLSFMVKLRPATCQGSRSTRDSRGCGGEGEEDPPKCGGSVPKERG